MVRRCLLLVRRCLLLGTDCTVDSWVNVCSTQVLVFIQWKQEHIEPAKLAREIVTSTDGEIQTWGANNQVWEGSSVRM